MVCIIAITQPRNLHRLVRFLMPSPWFCKFRIVLRNSWELLSCENFVDMFGKKRKLIQYSFVLRKTWVSRILASSLNVDPPLRHSAWESGRRDRFLAQLLGREFACANFDLPLLIRSTLLTPCGHLHARSPKIRDRYISSSLLLVVLALCYRRFCFEHQSDAIAITIPVDPNSAYTIHSYSESRY